MTIEAWINLDAGTLANAAAWERFIIAAQQWGHTWSIEIMADDQAPARGLLRGFQRLETGEYISAFSEKIAA